MISHDDPLKCGVFPAFSDCKHSGSCLRDWRYRSLTFPGPREHFNADRRRGGIRGVLGGRAKDSGEAAAT